jgi:hypothetical protein
MRKIRLLLTATAALAAVLLVPACGDDDSESSTTTTEATSTTAATDTTADSSGGASGGDGASSFPSEEFCDAVTDFQNAQDGAERNQALGDMADAAGADVPPAISQALQDLDTGDLPAEVYDAAGQALETVCSQG